MTRLVLAKRVTSGYAPAHQRAPAQGQRHAAVDQLQGREQQEPNGHHGHQPQTPIQRITPIRSVAAPHHHLGEQQGNQAVADVGRPHQAGKGEAHGGNHSAEQQQLQLDVITPQEPLNQSHQHLGHCRCLQVRQ